MQTTPTQGQYNQIRSAVGNDILVEDCSIISQGCGQDSPDKTYFQGSFIVMVEGSIYRFNSDRTYRTMRG